MKFEATITSLENSRDLSKITFGRIVKCSTGSRTKKANEARRFYARSFPSQNENQKGDKGKKKNKKLTKVMAAATTRKLKIFLLANTVRR